MASSESWAPLQLSCGAQLRNRFILAPMTTNSSNPDGTVSDAELAYIRRRCVTEFAAGITSCAYVDDDGRSWQGIGAEQDAHIDSLREVAKAFKVGGGLAILQLYDGGRLADPKLVAPDAIRAPSAVPSLRPGARIPRAMTGEEVEGLIESFVAAAKRGAAADFHGIELHGANHYLIQQFFSPRSNKRTDRWGGSAENRMRFPLELTAAVKAAVGERMFVGYRINALETEDGGYSLDDAALLCSRLCELGVDYIHISMDDFRKRSPMREDRDWTAVVDPVELANPISALSRAIDGRTAVIASGGVKSLEDAHAALSAGATLVAVGRAALIDPEWLAKLANDDTEAIRRELPATSARIEAELTIPRPMVDYLLSRPRWMPRESEPA
jgi:2,4-dienoyl-CoA reductase-like NADH-dependent reductase (Old Yellow Enzyme family)